MREYGQIQCSFWARAVEEGWTTDAMLLGAYLLTGPHSNGIGCYRLPDGYICDDLGWDHERVSDAFDELFRKGFCNRFGTVVSLPKFLKWNPIANGNVAKRRQIEFEAIPNDEAKIAQAVVLLEFGNHWDNGFKNRLETLSKRFGKPLPKQDPILSNPIQSNSIGRKAPDERKKATKKFSVPTVQEVQAYCAERQNTVNPQHFVDHYQAKGWVVGKSPMKDWKAAVRTWEGRDSKGEQSAPTLNGEPKTELEWIRWGEAHGLHHRHEQPLEPYLTKVKSKYQALKEQSH